MKKYELWTKEELIYICENSISYSEIAKKLGYSQGSGSSIKTIKTMIKLYGINDSHLLGQTHGSSKGKYKTPIEDYLNNKIKITSHKLRVRLLDEEIMEYKCNRCGNTHWIDSPIPLELHHIDGNKNNNSLNNLELLCPNCHYFLIIINLKIEKFEH